MFKNRQIHPCLQGRQGEPVSKNPSKLPVIILLHGLLVIEHAPDSHPAK